MLKVNSIYKSEEGVKLGLCQAPGKVLERGRDGKARNRNLEADLRYFYGLGIRMIMCLLNDFEMRTIGVNPNDYRQICRKLGIQFRQFPIVEMCIPDSMDAFHNECILPIHQAILSRESVLVHCRGGIGRAGMTASCYLCAIGMFNNGDDAIRRVREARDRRCVETARQEDFVRQYCSCFYNNL